MVGVLQCIVLHRHIAEVSNSDGLYGSRWKDGGTEWAALKLYTIKCHDFYSKQQLKLQLLIFTSTLIQSASKWMHWGIRIGPHLDTILICFELPPLLSRRSFTWDIAAVTLNKCLVSLSCCCYPYLEQSAPTCHVHINYICFPRLPQGFPLRASGILSPDFHRIFCSTCTFSDT